MTTKEKTIEYKPGTKQRVGSGTKKKNKRTLPVGEDNSFRQMIAWGMSVKANGQVVLGGKKRGIARYYRIAEAKRYKQARRDGFLRGPYLPTPRHGKKSQQAQAKANQEDK